jgi:hypothetical protein
LHPFICHLPGGPLRTLGIDEISYAKGHKYATVVYDLERACVACLNALSGVPDTNAESGIVIIDRRV